ncbi:sarcosine oxidase subunit beta family protein [Rhodobacteraceae bacterium N5(2021)]|uniref:Sarcosine oxidase subunit beta n=1 Tax=Gymnodinialimonas phycosphaerae TaxID=2841589 RepID=A0A975TV68_9RHOB|nr:sarcosine oxidase subunit beta family protein [Gymnodinialimonas phycosphaerae]MBY4891341.1 sarcosine oxidase subunit beta family protein [Gymnodinialimonas phycosphaerae]
MKRHSAFTLAQQALRGHKDWPQTWAKGTLKPKYDAVVIGGGGHGLATAYYLAKTHGITRVAVLEKGWIGGGNTGRNTTVIRSNYFYPESVALYDLALRLYEGLSRELNYNIMLSQRGMLIAAHTPAQMEICARIANAMQINGVDGRLMDAQEATRRVPLANQSADARYRLTGGIWQDRAGVARHDAVAWGYARAASALGVDIIENCEVIDIIVEAGCVTGVETTHGRVKTSALGLATAGATTGLTAPHGISLPIQTYALQAFVSEPVKPVLDTVLLYLGTGTYLSQSDKGELVIGGGLDRVPTHGKTGNLPMQEQIISGLLEMFPAFGQLKLLRQWAGVVDVVPDSSPILGPAGPKGLFLNCGWGTGGFKAIPAGGTLLAHMLATGGHHDISRPFDLTRFITGRLIDEAAGSGIAH